MHDGDGVCCCSKRLSAENGSSCVVVVMGLSALEHCIESLTDPFAEPAWSSQLALAAIN